MSEDKQHEIVTQASADEAMSLLSRGDKMFLLQVRMAQPLSKCVVDDGTAKAGDFYLGFKDTFKNLGPSFKAVVGPYRAHALLLVDNKPEAESFDANSAEFKAIEKEANGQKRDGRAPMFGLDFLFYLPEHDTWAVYFFAKTARRNAKPLIGLGGKMVEIVSKKITNKKHTWYVPEVVKLSEDAPTVESGPARAAADAFNSGQGGGAEDEEGAGESAPAGRPR